MIPYSHEHDPPAPVIDVTVLTTRNRRLRRTVPALLDTGSDVTAIPDDYISALRLYPTGELHMEGIDATTTTVYLYGVRLVVGDLSIPMLEVASTGLNFVVLGRDVLNQLYLNLDGPNLRFDVESTPHIPPTSSK